MKITKQISLTRFLKPKIEDDINREFEKIILDLEIETTKKNKSSF
jgi:hypothetical protein